MKRCSLKSKTHAAVCALALAHVCFLPSVVFAALPEVETGIEVPEHSRLSRAEFVSLVAHNLPEIARGRITVRRAESESAQTLAIFDPQLAVTYETLASRARVENELSSGIAERYSHSLNASIGRLFASGGTLTASFNQSLTRSKTPYEIFGETIEQGVPWNYGPQLTIAFEQPLLEGRGRRVTMLAHSAALRRAEAERVAVEQQISAALLNALSVWLEVRFAEEEHLLRERSLARTTAQLEAAGALVEGGRIASYELELFRERVAAGLQELVASRVRVQALSRTLADLVGAAPGEQRFGSGAITIPPDELDGAAVCAAAAARSPEVLAARAQLVLAETAVDAASDSAKATLDVWGSFSTGGLDENVGAALAQMATFESIAVMAGLRFSAPIRNRAALESVKQAAVDVDRARLEVALAERAACFAAMDTHEELGAHRDRYSLAAYRTGAVERVLDAEEERFARGLSTVQQTLDALERVEAAELSALRVRLDGELAFRRMQHLTGTLLSESGAAVDMSALLSADGTGAP